MFMIYKFHKNLFFSFPKIFDCVAIEHKNCNTFDYLFNVKVSVNN